MKIVIAGGTGFIGNALIEKLQPHHQLVVLTRRSVKPHECSSLQFLQWDGKNPGDALEGADAVINLAGEPVAGRRWTSEIKRRIVESRVEVTRSIVQSISKAGKKPSLLINASAVGYYGNVPQGDVLESHPRGKGFLAEICEAWENEARKAEEYGVRVVLLRTGIVLEKGGGALAKMLPPFHFFAGGPIGSGQQWFPWIHREDVIEIILFALSHSISGPLNVNAPGIVTMKDFSRKLGRALGRPSWLPLPSFAVRLLFGEMGNVLLEGQKAVPDKLQAAGFSFRYPELESALRSILKS